MAQQAAGLDYEAEAFSETAAWDLIADSNYAERLSSARFAVEFNMALRTVVAVINDPMGCLETIRRIASDRKAWLKEMELGEEPADSSVFDRLFGREFSSEVY